MEHDDEEKLDVEIICDICGKNIELEAGAMVSDELQDGTCFNICFDCIESYYSDLAEAREKHKSFQRVQHRDKMRPSRIKAYLDDYIIGQENAKKRMSVAVYNHWS